MIECGEIYFISGDKSKSIGKEIWAGRPGIIISSPDAIKNQGTVNVVFLTSSKGNKTFTVDISDADFLPERNKFRSHRALCSQIHTVDKSRIESYYGKVTDEELQKIRKEIRKTLFN